MKRVSKKVKSELRGIFGREVTSRELIHKGLDGLRRTYRNYLVVFAGDFGGLFMQIAYFLILANVFSLVDMGIFTTTVAVGMILGSLAGVGFVHQAYRVAAGRRRVLSTYMTSAYVALVASLPIGILIALPIYFAIFSERLPLGSFIEILFVELFVWRLVELLSMVNHGLGHFKRATTISVIALGMRALAAFVFMQIGGAQLTTWIHIYLAANIFAVLILMWKFHPPFRFRLNWKLLLGRTKESVHISLSNFMGVVQREIDKVIVLVLVGDAAAGIYAISMRVLHLIAVPIGSFIKLYSRRLISEKSRERLLVRNLSIEGALFVISTIGFIVLMAILSVWPGLLGSNIEEAKLLYGTLLFIPAFNNLILFHIELYFAYGHQMERAIASFLVNLFKALALAAIVTSFTAIEQWGFWLNLVFAVMYLGSVTMVYGVLTGRLHWWGQNRLNMGAS